MPRNLKGTFIRILQVDTKVELEIKYAVIFSSYIFIYVKNTMEIFNIFLFYAIVPIQSITVSWTLDAHLVFSSYICCLQNTFEAPEITESDEEEDSEEGALYWCRDFWWWGHLCGLTVQYQMYSISILYSIINTFLKKIKLTPPLFNAFPLQVEN